MQEHTVAEQTEAGAAALTERLYYTDSHLKEFDAVVAACEPFGPKDGYDKGITHRVVLNATAFFPEGGGQYGDVGSLDKVSVLDTREKNGIIYHYTDGALEPGQTVHGTLNWQERFSRMQQHSGEHVVSGLVHQMKGYDNVGFHLGPTATTLDFNGPLTVEELAELERRANQAVADNIEVQVSFPTKEEEALIDYRSKIDIEGQVRLVTFPGIDVCACCAPHVYRTGEIGLIKFADAIAWKGGVRLTILCGFRALADYNEKSRAVKNISNLLSAAPAEVDAAVERVKAQSEERREKLIYWQKKLIASLPEKCEEITMLFEPELDKNVAREYVNEAVARGAKLAGSFVGNDQTGYSYIIGSGTQDLRPLAAEMKTALQARGGGKAEMIQGQVLAPEGSLRNFFLRAR